jgi:hypothetical protein
MTNQLAKNPTKQLVILSRHRPTITLLKLTNPNSSMRQLMADNTNAQIRLREPFSQ